MRTFSVSSAILFIMLAIANVAIYRYVAMHRGLPDGISGVLVICILLLQTPGFLIVTILLWPIRDVIPPSIGLLAQLFVSAAINAVIYVWTVPRIPRFLRCIPIFLRYMWFASLPEDMRELEHELLRRRRNV